MDDPTKGNKSKLPRGECRLSLAAGFGLVLLAVGVVVTAVLVTSHLTSCANGGPLSKKIGPAKAVKVVDVRLPTHLKPLYYKVDLIPYVEEAKNFTIDGKYDIARDFYTVTIPKSLEVGKLYRIFIPFSSLIADSLGGFYKSSYKDVGSNATRYLGTTFFEPIDARRAFPCFDEPQLKAKFEISLARRVNMSSISNMKKLNRTEPV
ncbi:Aminopeptidase 1 [Folsomia candida]|uniref:Aminopeptidase 1 n=1 Tax=Folsomia candida TaxID=158441 RepID=A0A226ED13_FOLCA|nr:Aminopeptidase 1 [Folsomia candida]